MTSIKSKVFARRMKKRFERISMEVGIMQDKPYRRPLRDAIEGSVGIQVDSMVGFYAGGPISKASRKSSGMTVGQVATKIREELGVDWLREPFGDFAASAQSQSADLRNLLKRFFDLALGRSQPKRLENALQALVRNPILRQEYGTNSRETAERKTFNRFLFDTGQFFKAIKAKVSVR